MKKMLIGLVAIATMTSAAIAAPGATVSAKQRMKFVRVARNLEIKPLAFDSVQKRQWATEFLVKTPNLRLELCQGVLDAPLHRANSNYNNQLSMQFLVSSAAYMLGHPRVKDPVKIQAAGVEGTLKAYESILKVDQSVRFDFLDQLVQEHAKGALESYVAVASHACGTLDEQAPKMKRKLIP